jgi:hypothetical protein
MVFLFWNGGSVGPFLVESFFDVVQHGGYDQHNQ